MTARGGLTTWLRHPIVVWGLMAALILGLLVVLTAVTTSTPVAIRGAGVFGRMANKIKGNPGGTAAVALGAVAMLWIGLGALAAWQAWLAEKQRSK